MKENTELIAYCKSLRLPFMKSYLKNNSISKSQHQLLTELFKEEANLRVQNGIENKIRTAKFPMRKYINTLNREMLHPNLNSKLDEFTSLQFIENNENIILVGSAGVGKTHTAIGLGLLACHAGYKVKYYQLSNLITSLRESQSNKQLVRFQNQFKNYDLVIIDELGYVKLESDEAELLFSLISTRGEERSLIVTTNLMFDRWNEVFGNIEMTGALVDRLAQRAHIISMVGESYRFHQTEKLNS